MGRQNPGLFFLDRVSTATVYALCGAASSARPVSNAIRLRVEDLEDVICRGGR
jgi:hypothetical protein